MKKTVIAAIVAIFLIAFVPLFVLKDAEFGGSDDAGSVVVEEVDSSYEPWATPVFEQLLGGELPGEVESPPLRGNPEHSGNRSEKTSGSYSLPECCDRTFRRSGFHTCPSCNSQGF